jgi:hypothetical protein
MARKFLAALLAAVSIMPGMAAAQDRGDRGGGRAEGMQQRQAGGGNAGGWQQRQPQRFQAQSGGWQQQQQQQRGGERRQAQSGGWNRPQTAVQPRLPAERRDDRAGYRGDRGNDRQSFNGQRPDAQRNWSNSGANRNDQRRWNNGGSYRNDQRSWNGSRDDRSGWNRDWRRDSRYDWNRWRASNRNAFRLPRYYAPYGWNAGYRSFGIGAVLSSMLFAQDYWISDPWSYRLPEVDGSYRWVRYYNDALLVDVYSGEVVDVVNGIFW